MTQELGNEKERGVICSRWFFSPLVGTRPKRALFALIVFHVVVALSALAFFVYSTNERSRAGRSELLEFWGYLEVGQTEQEVRLLFHGSNYKHLTIWEGDSPYSNERWHIRSPMGWDAQNWCINLLFDKGRLLSAKIRTLNDETVRPRDVPADKGNSAGDW